MMPQRPTTIWIEFEGKPHKVVLDAGSATPVCVDGVPFAVDARELSPGVLSLLLTLPDGTSRSFECIADSAPQPAISNPAVLIDGQRFAYALTDPRSLRAASGGAAADAGPRPLKSPMPGRILRVLVKAGDLVEAGQGCIVIEAMKMQNELKAPRSGAVTRLQATVGETVTAGAILLVVE